MLSVAGLSIPSGCGNTYVRTFYPAPMNNSSMTVMTFNVRTATVIDLWRNWAFRRQRVIDTIASNAPDVIGVQEAQHSQVRDIQDALPQYASYAVGRGEADSGETCAVFYLKRKYMVLDSGTFWFSETPDVPGSKSWGSILPRICTWVHLAERQTGRGIYVYNIHLNCFSHEARNRSLALLAERVAARKTRDPFVVMGDFNMKADDSAMAYLYALGCMETGSGTGAITRYSNDASTRIDHICLSKGLVGRELSVDKPAGRKASDHKPRMAEVRLAS